MMRNIFLELKQFTFKWRTSLGFKFREVRRCFYVVYRKNVFVLTCIFCETTNCFFNQFQQNTMDELAFRVFAFVLERKCMENESKIATR